MTEKRTIDPKVYGVIGYGNQPAYNLPFAATGHLVEYPARDARDTLCGKPRGSLHDRVVKNDNHGRAWAKVCALCTKVAKREGLVEWAMPPLRKGDCPVLSERTGERTKHIIIPYRPRCRECPAAPRYKHTERCSARHNTYARCYSCGYEDETKHYCDYIVGRSMGIATDFGACNRGATEEQRHVPDRYHQPDGMVWAFLCKQHTPEAIQTRSEERNAKYRAYSAASDAREAERQSRHDAFDIAVEMARWIAANRELVETDEWLAKIATQMASNDAIQKGLIP